MMNLLKIETETKKSAENLGIERLSYACTSILLNTSLAYETTEVPSDF